MAKSKSKKKFLQAALQEHSPIVDENIIKNVSVCSCGPALGHDILIDETCLQQIVICGNAAPKGVKVGMGHEARITELVGFIQNFRVVGAKVLGDLHLLATSEHADYVKELATTMPNEIGLSVAMEGADEEIDGTLFARCSRLFSVDLVKEPAANPDGLYEIPQEVDEQYNFNAMTTEEFQKLFSDSIAPLKLQLEELQASFGKKFAEAETASTGTNLEATGTDAADDEDEDNEEDAVTGNDLSAMVLTGLRKLLSESNVKIAANPQTGTGKAPVVEAKSFEDHVIEIRKSGKSLWEATKQAKNEFAAEYENYLERSAKDSEARQHAMALGTSFKSLVNQKAFSTKL